MANYGSPPYEESTFRKALRMLTIGAAGWGAVRPGSNFGEAFLSAGGRSAIAAQQASQAAQDYAIRQEEIQRRREEDAVQQKHIEALTKRLERPEPPKKPDIYNMTDEEYKRYLDREGKRLEIKEGIKAKFRPKKDDAPDKPRLGDLNTISDNFRADKDVQNFTVVRDNYRRIDRASRLKSGTGDLAAIFSYMRVLDPESVVRETEFKNAESAVGYVQKTYNLPAHWFRGARLTDAGRVEFRRSADTLYRTQKKTYDAKVKLFKRQAEAYRVDPTLVIPDYDDTDVGQDVEWIMGPDGNLVPANR